MGRTQTIGVVVSTIADPFIAEIVQSIENTAHLHGYCVILASSNSDPEREIAAVEMVHSKRVDGVIVVSSRVGALYQKYLDSLAVPVVLLNSHSEQRGPYTYSVSVDNALGGYVATTHLVDAGHRRIAYVRGAEEHSNDLARFDGYRQALSEAGLGLDPALVVLGTGSVEGGEHALVTLSALSERPTAAFCYNDMTAIGLLRAARGNGVSVPGELAVVGFDDIPLASYVEPSLTTVAQPTGEMGEQAMKMVLDLLLARGEGGGDVANVVVQGNLVVRMSSGTTGLLAGARMS
jgi:DNA-binding LacI/PurR family transcriptional regulator